MNKGTFDRLFFSKTRDFLGLYLSRQCSRSKHTIKGYRDALTIFRRYVTEEKGFSMKKFTFDDCTREFVLSFMLYLQNNGYARTTCNQRLAALKAYVWYVADGDIAMQQIALSVSHVPFLKEPDVEKEMLNEECLTAMLSAPGFTKIGIRDTTIMVILYDTAIRLSEILELKLSDINLSKSTPYLRIHGKGDKERIVSVTDKTVSHIKRYLNLYHNAGSPETDLVFYTVIKENVGGMSPGNIERIINKYANIVRRDHPDLPKKVHPHMFRRTRCTNLYQSDVELELVSRIMGHSSTQVTRIYAKPSLEMIRDAMEKSPYGLTEEEPLWMEDEEELARLCGLR
jgi:site-specific recombinase XerD